MKETIENKILNKIHGKGRGWVFSPMDFASIGSRSTIDSALHRFENKGKIRRLIRGIYYYPRSSDVLGQELAPDIDLVAQSLAQKFGWRIQPSGAMAQNLLGLSTQVPTRALYVSDGPDRSYKIGETSLIFEHIALKNVGFKRRESGLIVQALKSFGENRITPKILIQIRDWLDPALRPTVLSDTKSATGWIYAAIQEITREASHG